MRPKGGPTASGTRTARTTTGGARPVARSAASQKERTGQKPPKKERHVAEEEGRTESLPAQSPRPVSSPDAPSRPSDRPAVLPGESAAATTQPRRTRGKRASASTPAQPPDGARETPRQYPRHTGRASRWGSLADSERRSGPSEDHRQAADSPAALRARRQPSAPRRLRPPHGARPLLPHSTGRRTGRGAALALAPRPPAPRDPEHEATDRGPSCEGGNLRREGASPTPTRLSRPPPLRPQTSSTAAPSECPVRSRARPGGHRGTPAFRSWLRRTRTARLPPSRPSSFYREGTSVLSLRHHWEGELVAERRASEVRGRRPEGGARGEWRGSVGLVKGYEIGPLVERVG